MSQTYSANFSANRTPDTIWRGDKTFDPAIEMPGDYFFGTPQEIDTLLTDDFAYSELLSEADVPARITINPNADNTTYYTVWHYIDGTGTIQFDTIDLREATPTEIEQYHADKAAKAAWIDAQQADVCTTGN